MYSMAEAESMNAECRLHQEPFVLAAELGN
jgi:hypothetical protein